MYFEGVENKEVFIFNKFLFFDLVFLSRFWFLVIFNEKIMLILINNFICMRILYKYFYWEWRFVILERFRFIRKDDEDFVESDNFVLRIK